MTETGSSDWFVANQRYLSAALGVVRAQLQAASARQAGLTEAGRSLEEEARQAWHAAAAAMPAPSTLETLCALFGLTSFERSIVLLCAGMELDSSFAALCAEMPGQAARAYPTFSLALATFPEAHWSALTPVAPLRRWHLVELGSGHGLTQAPLTLDERILHYLSGLQYLDERLKGMVEPLAPGGELLPSHQCLVEQIQQVWQRGGSASLPVIQLCGSERGEQRLVAARVCEAAGLHLFRLPLSLLPASPEELERFACFWEREALLSVGALLLECEENALDDVERLRTLQYFVEHLSGPLLLARSERYLSLNCPSLVFEVNHAGVGEQRFTWQKALGEAAQQLNGHLEQVIAQFHLSTTAIQAISSETLSRVTLEAGETPSLQRLSETLWDVCRVRARPRLDDLAQRIEPVANWDDLILPEMQRQTLRDIAAHVRRRHMVYETWGFAARGERGLGISALFSGASGTGKTMAAEVLAHELRLDLYRIDLSQVVSKYIGETEKNLRRVFDAAEEGGVILLFDEADSLFGKRSEVKDSHDRYANIEVSYLLQRMEAYRGLAILTTNLKSALDQAFLRRIRFIVQFPFPDHVQRAEIWRRIFPPLTPTEDLHIERLAQLNITGGHIRNIALNAAFLAADVGQPVRMSHLLHAARSEYTKLEKNLTDVEIGGWV